MVGQNCPHWHCRIQFRFAFERKNKYSPGGREIGTHETAEGRQLVFFAAAPETSGYAACYNRRLTSLDACLPTHDFHLQRQKFWITLPGIRTPKTPSMGSFIGGCSTLACKNGRRKLRRASRNSSNKVFSNKSDLRTATSFTTSHRIIWRRFSNGHDESNSDANP